MFYSQAIEAAVTLQQRETLLKLFKEIVAGKAETFTLCPNIDGLIKTDYIVAPSDPALNLTKAQVLSHVGQLIARLEEQLSNQSIFPDPKND